MPIATFVYDDPLLGEGPRRVVPNTIFYGIAIEADGPCWYLSGFDLDAQDEADFALARITDWCEPLTICGSELGKR